MIELIRKYLNFRHLEKETVLEAVFKSTVINTFARLFGYLKNVAIAVLLGFSAETDAFFMAMSLAGFFLIFADVFDSVGVPNLVRARIKEGEEEFERLASFMLFFTTILVFVVVCLYIVASPLIFKIPVGFNEKKLVITRKCYYILLFYVIFYFYYHHFGAVHRAARRFTVFYLGQLVFSFSAFVLIALGLLYFKSIWVLPAAIALSQVMATLFIISQAKHFSFKFFLDNRTRHILKQFFQLCALYAVSRLYTIVDRGFASVLPTKSVTALTYGYMVAFIPKNVMRLENILITPLSESNASKSKVLFYTIRILAISSVFAVSIFVLSPYMVKLLFGYGAFSHVDWKLTTEAAKFYALSIPSATLWPVYYRVYQIKDKIYSLVPISLISVITNTVLNYLFVFELKLGIKGVCLGTLGAYMFLNILGIINIYSKEDSSV